MTKSLLSLALYGNTVKEMTANEKYILFQRMQRIIAEDPWGTVQQMVALIQ